MKAATQITTSPNVLTKTQLVVLFALLLLSSVGMVGQNAKPVVNSAFAFEVSVASVNETLATTKATTTTNTTMNFVSWFMGTKQSPSSNQSNDFSTNTKKQMIHSGIAPNRLLIKTFLKKATNYNNTIA